MDQLKKTLQILKEIRQDVLNHDRRYIGKVRRQDAIEALTGACICLEAIVKYNEIRENEEDKQCE